jgi:hypothetical protein
VDHCSLAFESYAASLLSIYCSNNDGLDPPVVCLSRWPSDPRAVVIYERYGAPAYAKFMLSPFCKHCYDEGIARSCWRVSWRTKCRITHDGPCLYVISYQPHPAEDISIDDIPEYRIKRLAMERLNTIGTPWEIPTAKTERSQFIRPLSPPKQVTVETAAARREPIVSEPRPTYSQVRSAYEDTTQENHQCITPKPPPEIRIPTVLPTVFPLQSIPVWVADENKFRLENGRFFTSSLPLSSYPETKLPTY